MEESEYRKIRRVSATEASRSFRWLLNAVESGGRFLIHRHGKDICLVESPPVPGRLASRCLEILRGREEVRFDDEFGRDLLEILSEETVEGSPWDS